MNTSSELAGYVQGLPIYLNEMLDPKPKMTLSERVPVTPEFRAEMNAWMADFFGYDEGQILQSFVPGQQGIFMGPQTFRRLQLQAEQQKGPA